MTRNDFLTKYWRYYLFLEKDFIKLTRYIGLDKKNFNVFSDEIHKQLISIGVEFENICKEICKISNINLPSRPDINKFKQWIPQTKIEISSIYSSTKFDLTPFEINNNKTQWAWWKSYNNIKHNKFKHYENVNFEALINALSALFYAEMYLIREIGNTYNDVDVPDEYSRMFEIKGWQTKHQTVQIGTPMMNDDDMAGILKKIKSI